MASPCYDEIAANGTTTGFLREARPSKGILRSLVRLPMTIFNLLLVWQERATQRVHLSSLPDELLKDMGLSPEDARREASKPFWRA